MASRQVQEIKLRLVTEGGEGLDKLKSSFRELGKAIGPTGETIEKTRRAIIEFGEAGNKSEQLIKGQIAAFKGLQSQATIGGKVYNNLKKDIKELEGVIYGANAALEEQRKRLTQFGTSSDATAFQIQQTINALIRLRSETRVDSEAFDKFGESISTLTNRLRAVNQETQNFADAQRRIVRPIGASSAAARQQIRDLELVTEALRDQRDELGALEGEARLRRGVADLAERGVRGTGRLSFEEALAESLLGGQALRRLLPVKDIESALDEVRRRIGDFQREIEVNLSKGIQRSFQETARAGRESARAMAAAFSDPELINVFNRFDDRLGEIPQTATGFSQRLRELQQVFANTARSAENYISIALDIARVQREASAATQGLGAALVRDLNTGVAVRNKKNLQEAIGQLQAEMNELDTQTAEGSRLYAENANQVRNLERQLRELGDSYRHVADMATRSATAQAGINPFLASGARNPLFDEDIARQAVEGVKEFKKTYTDTLDFLISAKQTFREREAQLIEQNNQKEEEASRAQIARDKAEAEAADRAFLEQVKLRSDSFLDVQRSAAASAMGLGGRDLSSLYQRITGLAGASVQREQLMMGRSATQVLTDMFTAFEKGGRGVDIKNKSTEIGESIAQGIAKGASDKSILISGANNLSDQFISSLKRAFRIKSPSGESHDEIGVPIGQGIGKGIVQGLKEVRGEVLSAVRVLFSDIAATPQRAALPAQETALADKLQSFLARSSAKTSTFLPFARLMGEEAVSSPALTLATYRKAYERGGIVPPMYMPVEKRRNVRGVSGIPGYGLEQEIVAGAIRNVGRTGALVGPLSGPQVSQLGARSAFSSLQAAGFSAAPFAGQIAPLFGASSPIRARGAFRYGMAAPESFPIEGMLGQGRSLSLGREGAATSTKEAISSYRKAVSNFWEGETGTFETIRRIVSSGVQLSASKLARRLTESVELPSISGVAGRIRGAMPSISGLRAALPNVSIPGLAAFDEFLTGNEAFERQFNVIEGAVGASRLRGFPVSGMAQIGNVASGGGSFVPLAGGGGIGGGVRPPAGVVPPAAPSEYEKLISAVNRFGDVSRRSTADLRDFSGSLRLLQDILDPTAADFKQVNQEIEKQGRLVDRELEKRQRGGRRRMTGMQMTQAAGAALSGGIFGGPEGFLGGAIGSAFGVGGAFAGAAIGAQVGGLRQQLGGFADYAAQIQKMQIALENAAGSQSEFNRAMAAAASATQNLNVPQDVAIQGMTKLTAAVKGAGGQVSDAELVFRNVTSAIKATGGSAQDVDGAITAMVQVFSKGKVSAEELSGQLGERLPGAVTKFAEANNMTLPELQKALEQGQVGLNELMNFIIQLGGEYSEVAQKIAASSQDAGARLTVAFNDMKIAVGETLQPIGAQFQEAFIPFIENITPVLVNLLPKIGEFALSVAKNLDVLAAAAGGAALAMGALSIASIKVAGTAGLSLLGVAMMKAASAAGALTVALKASSVAALLNPWVALAAGIAAATVALIKHNQAQQEYNNLLDNGAGSTDELRLKQRELESEITAARKALEGSADGMGATGRRAMQLKIKIAELESQLARINKTFTVRLKLEREGFTFDKKGRTETFTVAGIVYDANGVPIRRVDGSPLNGVTDFQSPTGDEKKSGKTKKERESQLPQLMAELAVQQQIAQINEKIRNAQLAENQFLQIRLEGERELAQIQGDIQKIALEKIPADEAKAKRDLLMIRANEARKNTELRLQQAEKQNLVEITQQSDELAKSYTTQLEDRQRLQELVASGMKEALALEYIQIENMLKLEKERLEVRKALLLEAGDVGGAETTQDLIDRLGSKETGLKGLATAAQPEEKGKIQEFIEQAEAELKDLEAFAVRISQNIGSAIGDSLVNGVTGLIEGTTTAKEVFANFLKDVGQILAREGARMIAIYIAIGIAKAFAGLAAGASGKAEMPGAMGKATTTGLDTGAGNVSDMLSGLAAKGAYFSGGQADFAQNSIKPFATGGIVTRPTFFKYAKGGEMQNGLMGEAGPEAIMPLKRGADGKLGVTAKLDGAMGRYRRSPGSAGGPAGGGVETESGAAAAAMQPIDVRYSVERINSVDYVTADQFQAGMRQAAAQGAKQGEQRALNSLRQNTTTRRKVGI